GVSNGLIDLLETAERGEPVDEKLEKLKRQHLDLAADLGVDGSLLDELFEKLEQTIAGVKLVGEVSPRVHARVLATGELAATTLGAAYLNAVGVDTRWLDARELLTSAALKDQTERARYLSARCEYAPDPALKARLEALPGVIL